MDSVRVYRCSECGKVIESPTQLEECVECSGVLRLERNYRRYD